MPKFIFLCWFFFQNALLHLHAPLLFTFESFLSSWILLEFDLIQLDREPNSLPLKFSLQYPFPSPTALHPLSLFSGEEVNMRTSQIAGSGPQNRYVYESKPSVQDHLSLDLHLLGVHQIHWRQVIYELLFIQHCMW